MPDPKEENTLDAEWVTAAVAQKLLGVPVRRVHRLGERGDVQRRLADPSNNKSPYLYFVPELKQFAPGEHAADPATTLALNQARLLEMSVNTIKEQWKMMHEPYRELVAELREETRALRADRKQMSDEYMAIVRMREELVDQKHTREMAEKLAEDSAALKRDALGLLKKAAPFIWGGVLETISRKQAFGVLRATLTPEQVQVILDADVLTDEQRELFRETFKQTPPQYADEPDEEPKPGESEQPP
jgi:hypothetical protein